MRIVRIEFQLIGMTIQVEHIRIAITVGIVSDTLFITAHLSALKGARNWAVFYLGSKIRQRHIPSEFLFSKKTHILSAKS